MSPEPGKADDKVDRQAPDQVAVEEFGGFVYVTATPYAALTDASGRVSIAGVPAGAAKVTVWHPSIRSPGGTASQPIVVSGTGLSTTFALHR